MVVYAITRFGPFDFAGNDPGVLEDFEMLTDGGLGKWKNTDNFSAYARIAVKQVLNDLNSSGMAKGLKNFSEFFRCHYSSSNLMDSAIIFGSGRFLRRRPGTSDRRLCMPSPDYIIVYRL
jgi:hypothetical protein